MSTQQPGGAPPPDGPGYAQPQDPWEGYEPGLASVPTDPIPQQYEPYGHYPAGDVWSQQTVAQGGYAPAPPVQPQGRRTGTVILVVLAVLLLGGGGGFAAWYITKQRQAGPNGVTPTNPVTTDPATATGTATPPTVFDPHTTKVNDCIQNNGTQADPDIKLVPCDTDSSYKIVRIVTGEQIVEGPGGTFDRDTTSVAACEGTGYKFWYGYQDPFDDAQDVFFCMIANP
jgi:hypothetical protein